MQNRDHYRVLEVKKNRYDGDVGRKGLIFDRDTKRFFELSRSQVGSLIDGKRSNSEILKEIFEA